MMILVLVAIAVVLLLLPSPKQAATFSFPSAVAAPVSAPQSKQVQYLDAVSALQAVRQRLVATEQLGDEQREAINILTLALVGGSEK